MLDERVDCISLLELQQLAELAGGTLEPSTTHYVIVKPICAWCRASLAACQRDEDGTCGLAIDNGAYSIYSVRAEKLGKHVRFVHRREASNEAH